MGQGASWVGLRFASALGVTCACALLLGSWLGCGESRDLDELGIPRPPDGGGVWYLEEMQRDRGDAGADDEGSSGSAGSGDVDDGASSGGGGRAGSGSSAGSSGGRAGSGGSGAGTVPLPTAGTGGGFQFPGAGGSGGSQFPGGGGMQQMPPPPPTGDISACSPCESLNGSLGGVPACCTADDQCGADLSALGGSAGCVDRDQPGTQDGQCPEVSIMNGGFQIPGCCLPSGRCGIVIMRLAPLGCVEPDVVEDLLQFDQPSGRPQSCRP